MREQSSLVEGGERRHGRFVTRPDIVNPMDEFSGLARAYRRLRLKEWIGFTLIHPDWYSSLIMQDANYLASSEIYAYDPRASAVYQHAANARGGSLKLPEKLAGASPRFAKPGYLIEYEFSGDGKWHRIWLDINATPKAPAFKGELELHGDRASVPLSVSSRLPGGKLYTHKALFPPKDGSASVTRTLSLTLAATWRLSTSTNHSSRTGPTGYGGRSPPRRLRDR